VTVWALLSDAAGAAGTGALFQPLVAAARAQGIAFRIGEGNTVSCGGRANVSDVFAAALYALDVQAGLAALGVAGWNWHGGPGAHYAPVSFARPPAPPGPPDVRPLFYGMWAFAAASRGGARIARAGVAASNGLIKVWALRAPALPRAPWTLLVIHKDANATGAARVSLAAPPGLAFGSGGGTLTRLLAPSVLARYGVSFAGQTLDGSADGVPVGERVTEAVAVQAGALGFEVPPASAALVTFYTE
jgi:hypothetical protein